MLEEKSAYHVEELFDALEITLAEMARDSTLSEVTLARIRDGRPARRPTVNKLLSWFSRYYDRVFTTRNVSVTIQEKRGVQTRKKEEQSSPKNEVASSLCLQEC